MNDRKDKVKHFLTLKLQECENIIKKRKRKNKIIKILYYTLISTSIVGSSIVVILSSLTIPPLYAACISAAVGILTALSVKFNLQNKKNKLEKNIQELAKIKDKLDYIISCNGDVTEEECNKILNQFRIL